MDFTSDNASGLTAPILEALAAANGGTAPAYGADPWTARAEKTIDHIFERSCTTFLAATGTGANAMALAQITPPHGAVFCHAQAHIIDDECGAPEFFTGGAKLVGIAGPNAKISVEALDAALARYPRGVVKTVQPASLSLSQATEAGTAYSCDEIARLCERAHAAGLRVHMDGARFANALVGLGASAAEMTWKAGIDVLSFGATKNGALACEAVVFFDADLASDFQYRRKRAGHTVSKGRFLGAQMAAYLDNDHWLANAKHANRAAARLEAGLREAGLRFPLQRDANELFPMMPHTVQAALKAAGARFYPWDTDALQASDKPGANEGLVRLVTSFATTDAEVDAFVARAKAARVAAPTASP